MTSYYTKEELKSIGFKSIGENVLISRKTSIYGASRVSIGNNVRIDDFTIISAGKEGIQIGNNVHIAVFCSIQGDARIILSDFCGISSKVAIYSSSDDYTGEYLTNPTVPEKYLGVITAEVFLGKHVIVGSGSVILPNIRLEDGVAIGALSLVNRNCQSFTIYSGNPIKKLCARNKNLLDLEQDYLSEQ